MEEWNKMNEENEDLNKYVETERKVWRKEKSELKSQLTKIRNNRKKIFISFGIIFLVLITGYLPFIIKDNLVEIPPVEDDWLEVFVYDSKGERDFSLIVNDSVAIIDIIGDYETLDITIMSMCDQRIFFSNIDVVFENSQIGILPFYPHPHYVLKYMSTTTLIVESIHLEIMINHIMHT